MQGSTELLMSRNIATLPIAYRVFLCIFVFGGSAVFFGLCGLCVLLLIVDEMYDFIDF